MRPWTALSLAAFLVACAPPEQDDDGSSPGDGSGESTAGAMPSAGTGEDGDGEPEPTSSGTTAGNETGVGSDGCGDGARCLPAPPDGWLGPVARFAATDGQSPPPCADGFPDDGFALLQGVTAPAPSQCECSCEVSVQSLCQVTMYPDVASATCSDFSNLIMNAGECTTYEIANGSMYGQMFQSGVPTCVADVPAELPPVAWDAAVYTCSGAQLGEACEDGASVCTPRAPDGFSAQLCVFAQGDNECPAGPFSAKTLLHTAVEDDRGCSPCECGPPPSVNCGGTFDIYDGDDCSGNLLLSAPPTGCSGAITGGGSIHINLEQDTSCTIATPSVAEGTVTPSGAFTYCCEP